MTEDTKADIEYRLRGSASDMRPEHWLKLIAIILFEIAKGLKA